MSAGNEASDFTLENFTRSPNTHICSFPTLCFSFPTLHLNLLTLFLFQTLTHLQIHLIFDEKIKTFRKTLIWGEKEILSMKNRPLRDWLDESFP